MKAWFTPIHADKESVDGSIGEMTFEQLYDCTTLLALSVVHHRAKFGVVPIEQSASEFGAAKAGSGSTDLLAEAKQTLEAALRHIKTLSSNAIDQACDRQAQTPTLEEKRQQIRIRISAPIHVLPHNTTTPLNAKLENISWGGAAFRVNGSVGEVGDPVHILLPSIQGRRTRVQGKILRKSDDPDGQTCVVRFTRLRTAEETKLQQFLEFLAEAGDDNGQRASARLARRIDIQYDDANELRATLEDISTGGLGITLPEPMDIDQSVLLGLSTTDEQCELLLRARVVRQQAMHFSELQMFRVGLKFEHPTEDIKERIRDLIRAIATINHFVKY